jgi:hypothetical protein
MSHYALTLRIRNFISNLPILPYCGFWVKSTAQEFPTKQIVSHLIEAGELSPTKNWDQAMEKVSIHKIFETENKGVFCFSTTYAHYYYFMLLKNKDVY